VKRAVASALAALLLAVAARADAVSLPAADVMVTAAARTIDGLAMRDGEDRSVSLSAYRGRVVVLNLWAPWCLPCRKEMPELAALQTQLRTDGVAVVPLAFDWKGKIGVRQFYAETGISNLPVLVGEGENLKEVTGLSGLPTTLILNGRGEHVATVAGAAQWSDEKTLAWLKNLSRR